MDAMAYARKTIEYIRRNDCDFITADTLEAYGVESAAAQAAVAEFFENQRKTEAS
jgi:hypothetical protein